MRRHPALAALLVLLVLGGMVPAYARVFTDTIWVGPMLVAGLLAAVIVAGLHRLGRGALLASAVSGVALISAIPWLLSFTSGPVLPRRELLADLAALWSQGLVELAETPAPTPTLAGLLLLLVVATWVVTHLAVLVLVRAERAGAPLVMLTALWVIPLVVPLPPISAVPAAVPFLATAAVMLLVTTPRTEATRGRTPVPVTGVVMAAGVIAAAIVVPPMLPGYDAPSWIPIGGGSEPRGYQPIVDVSDRLRLPEERDVLRLQSTQRTYLRLAGLDRFDGFTWRLGEPSPEGYRPDPANLVTATGPLPPEAPAASTVPVFVDVEVLALENIYVPIPYQPVEVLGPQRDDMVWSTDGGFLAALAPVGEGERPGIREGVDYRVEAARPAPTFDELLALGELSDPSTAAAAGLDPAELARWTDLPRSYEALGEQAREVYEAAGATTTVEQALALQDWFVGPAGGFSYDLEVEPLRDDDALERFVLEDRVGYCEYYATAMAVMLRETGIPARVAVGFLPGRVTLEPDPTNGRETTEFTVSTADAHAWVEVLFPRYGWVTFEPTPRDDETQIVPTESDLAPIENVRERRQRESTAEVPDLDPDDPLVPDIDDREGMPPLGAEDRDAAGSPAGGEDDGSRGIPLLLLVGALAAAAVGLVWWRRKPGQAAGHGRDPAARVLSAQRELLGTARRYGVGRRRHETMRELAARWQAEGRVDGQATRFALLAQAAAFGGEVLPEDAAAAEELASELQDRLRSSVSSRDQRLAPVRVPAEELRRATHQARTALRSRPDPRPASRPTSPLSRGRRGQRLR